MNTKSTTLQNRPVDASGPIRDLVIRRPGQTGVTPMVLQAYFDGSGKSHDPNIEYVAFAGYVATEQVWKEFEEAFERFKGKYRIEFIHTSATYGGQAPYEKLSPGFRAFMRAELVEILREFNKKKDFRAVAYAVSMTDYRAIDKALPSPEYICGSSCLEALCQSVPMEHELEVFYDRGESFFTEIQNRWRNKKERAREPHLNRINVFSQVDDWRKYPALQAADYLAYCVRDPALHLNLMMVAAGLSFYGGYYDKEKLEELSSTQQ